MYLQFWRRRDAPQHARSAKLAPSRPKVPPLNAPDSAARAARRLAGHAGVRLRRGGLYGSDAIAAMLRAPRRAVPRAQPRAPAIAACTTASSTTSATATRGCCLCLHEESAVAIAHGYAKVTGPRDGRGAAFERRPDACVDGHLQRVVRPRADAAAGRDGSCRRRAAPAMDRLDPHRDATRARWCATTPSGTTSRRRFPATLEALLRALQLAQTPPCAPTYVNLDAALQEAPLAALPTLPDAARYCAAARPDARRRDARRGGRAAARARSHR